MHAANASRRLDGKMLALLHRSKHHPPRFALPSCGGYLTDGHKLFCVVSQFAFAGDHVFAALEDCLTLDVRAYAPDELCEMALRPVQIDR
jgi:hypothetical protein